MEFFDFKNRLWVELKNEASEDVISLNDSDNINIIKANLVGEENLPKIKEFIDQLIDVIIDCKKFNLIESTLKNSNFEDVLKEFKKGKSLIRTCQIGTNRDAIKWILTMGVDINAQDENGMSAIMYVVQNCNLEEILDELLKAPENNNKLVDNQGNTALFYAYSNIWMFNKLLEANYDYNHRNNNGDTVLMYSCKKDKLDIFKILIEKPDIDVTSINNDKKNLSLLLIEMNKVDEMRSLLMRKNVDPNFVNESGESLVSTFFKAYYAQLEKTDLDTNYGSETQTVIQNFGRMFLSLVKLGCDFDCIIDENNTTPVLFLLLIEDYVSLYYLITHIKDLDLSVKNTNNVNASLLTVYMNERIFENLFCGMDTRKKILASIVNHYHISYKNLRKTLFENKTFDYDFTDMSSNTLLTYNMYLKNPQSYKVIKHMDIETIKGMNSKNENAVATAVKLGNNEALFRLLYPENVNLKLDVNHKDDLGNTALFYAIKLKDMYAINLLMNNQADPNIKNKEGVSPLDAANEINDETINEILKTPVPIENVKKIHGILKKIN